MAKVIARAGLASRREAETWIAAGRVAVNGKVLETPAVVIGPRDTVLVDGKPLPEREEARLWRYHKPEGLITTQSDPRGRPTVFDNLPENLPRVISVGRLDITSEGLLLLTNDGELARHLEMPSTGWSRRYRVRVYGNISQAALTKLANGCTIDGVRYGPMEARLERQTGFNSWLSVAIREGKNREVRKVLENLNLTVNRLIRVAYGPFQLATLPPGAAEEVKPRILREQLGSFLGIERSADQTGKAKAKPKSRQNPKPRQNTKPGQNAKSGQNTKPGQNTKSRANSQAKSGSKPPSNPGGKNRADRRRRP